MDIHFIDFIPTNAAHRQRFTELGREWLEEHNLLEPADEAMFADPEGKILAHDGAIIFAVLNGDIVGTGAVFRREEGVYELGKMSVTQGARGKGIGRRIAEALIGLARQKGARTLYLGSNTSLQAALALYRSLGFVETTMNHSRQYATCDVTMALELAS